jgi:hypothetical protein
MNVLVILRLAAIVVLTGCASVSSIDLFKQRTLTRAAYDLECPEEQVKVIDLAPNNYAQEVAVEGCGKRAVFVRVQQATGGATWIRNSDVAPAKAN